MKLEWWTTLEDDGTRYFLNGVIDVYGRDADPPEGGTASVADFAFRFDQVRVCFEFGLPGSIYS